MPEAEKAPEAQEKKLKKVALYWAIRILLVLIPVVGAYAQARLEGYKETNKAKVEAKKRSGIAYAEVAKAVQALQENDQAQSKAVQDLQTHVQVLEKLLLSMEGRSPVGHNPTRPVPVKPEPPKEAPSIVSLPAYKAYPMPKSLDVVTKQQGMME